MDTQNETPFEADPPLKARLNLEVKIQELEKDVDKKVTPESVKFRDLVKLLTNLQKAVIEIGVEDGYLEPSIAEDEADFSLISIGEGSNKLGLMASLAVAIPVNMLFDAIATGNFDSIPRKCIEHLNVVRRQVIEMRWDVRIASEYGDTNRAVEISERSVEAPSPVRTSRGGTNIYGQLIRIGGKKPRAVIQFDDGRRLSVKMSLELIKKLEHQERLYSRIGLEGVATWSLDDWSIEEFEAHRIIELSDSPARLTEMFERLAELDGDRWKGVDANEFIRELRSDDL